MIALSLIESLTTGSLDRGSYLIPALSQSFDVPSVIYFDNVPSIISSAFTVVTFVPGLAVIWRRLHDTDRSGARFFTALIPLLRWIIFIVLTALRPVPAGRRFDNPDYNPFD